MYGAERSTPSVNWQFTHERVPRHHTLALLSVTEAVRAPFTTAACFTADNVPSSLTDAVGNTCQTTVANESGAAGVEF